MTKILQRSEAQGIRDRDPAGTIVFTNGCFDILHVGHVRSLQAAKSLGDRLVVGLNSDESVRALKGANRPFNPESDRAEVLAALESVDYIVIFPEPRATKLLQEIRPHIYAKGGDYTPESLEQEEVRALRAIGTRIEILPLVPGKSTTNLIHLIHET
ncbi:MAG: adenylyltransferase/cytidyltransferase family protein [Chthoniobacterales bacterium]